jgi:hypothetical protein
MEGNEWDVRWLYLRAVVEWKDASDSPSPVYWDQASMYFRVMTPKLPPAVHTPYTGKRLPCRAKISD